jgi:hypothetical protein
MKSIFDYTMATKICTICNRTLLKDKFSDRISFCLDCYNERRRKKKPNNDKEYTQLESSNELTPDDTSSSSDDSDSSAQDDSDSNDQQYVYVMRSEFNKNNIFKIGMHIGDIDKLKNEYRTIVGDIEIIRFNLVDNAREHIRMIYNILDEYRLNNLKKWFKIDKNHLLNVFDDYFDKIEDSILNVFRRKVISFHNNVMKRDIDLTNIKNGLTLLVTTFLRLNVKQSSIS